MFTVCKEAELTPNLLLQSYDQPDKMKKIFSVIKVRGVGILRQAAALG